MLMEYALQTSVKENGIGLSAFLRGYYNMTKRLEDYTITADNVFQARTQVYRNWAALQQNQNIASRVVYIKYEELLANPRMVFSTITAQLRLPCADKLLAGNFDLVQARIKYGTMDKGSIDFQKTHPRKEFCAWVLTQEVYESLLAKIDREFDRQVLGYEYPEKRDEYCKEAEVTR